ncbi:hypothetical protein [Abyssogena phaseoliformis symbiont]|uniref:hypothetical protein n=1 Tax=Abyssogena phaseoliformis symbiont TaxID=596095 RepID=UPI001916080E|nr:hypothetical protein [Abyssogena phaseoliformis symbiont]
MFQISFYVPEIKLELVKNANPTIEHLDKLETIKEYKVEMICASNHLSSVISAMKSAHP